MRGDGEMDDPRYVKGAVGALWLMGDGMRQVGFFWEGGFSPELSFEGLTVLKLFLGFVRSSCFFCRYRRQEELCGEDLRSVLRIID